MGRARLEERAAALEGDIAAVGSGQALYEALIEALGYSKNMAPFRELARRLPLATLSALARGAPTAAEREGRIAGLLFGTAGFLPSQRKEPIKRTGPLGTPGARGTVGAIHESPLRYPEDGRARESRTLEAGPSGVPLPFDTYTQQAEEVWGWLGGMAPLPAGSWHTFRVRPENHPLRRVGAAAALVLRWLEADLVEVLRDAVRGRPRDGAKAVVESLRLGPVGYWSAHRDFGLPRADGPMAALVGSGRAREMAVSVALPFLVAIGDWAGDRDLEAAAHAAYAALPVPPENGLARWAAGRFLSGDANLVPLTAQRQQGLLHLAKTRLWVPGLAEVGGGGYDERVLNTPRTL